MTHIGLNAHLLSGTAGYRRAGIHGYIYALLTHLPAAAPGWQFSALIGAQFAQAAQAQNALPGNAFIRSRWNTDSPLRRILWEQTVQPFQLGQFDLVHEPAFVSPLLSRKPTVVTVHDLSFIRYPDRLTRSRRLYLKLFTRLSCQRARRVIAVSQSTADEIARLLGLPRDRIDVVLHGVESRFKPLPAAEVETFRREQSLPDRFLLFLGTIEPRKNLKMLIQAYAGLPPADRQAVKLVLAGGKGWMSSDLPDVIQQLDVQDDVIFPGYIADEQLPMWYNAAETFLYPSVYEGWGLPVVEAMACGKPVLVSDASSLPEAAGNAGRCLPPDDVQAWTEALAAAIQDDGWRGAQRQVSIDQAAQFDWHNTALQTLDCYRRALGGSAIGEKQ